MLTESRIRMELAGLTDNCVHRSDLASLTVVWSVLRGVLVVDSSTRSVAEIN